MTTPIEMYESLMAKQAAEQEMHAEPYFQTMEGLKQAGQLHGEVLDLYEAEKQAFVKRLVNAAKTGWRAATGGNTDAMSIAQQARAGVQVATAEAAHLKAQGAQAAEATVQGYHASRAAEAATAATEAAHQARIAGAGGGAAAETAVRHRAERIAAGVPTMGDRVHQGTEAVKNWAASPALTPKTGDPISKGHAALAAAGVLGAGGAAGYGGVKALQNTQQPRVVVEQPRA